MCSSDLFTGFYRLEYGLWHGQSAAELTGPANQLETDVRSLIPAYGGMQLQMPQALGDLALRTHEILENAMRFQISGQADFGGGTTLATTAAGIDATRAQLKMLDPLLAGRYPDLPSLYTWLDRLQSLIDAEKTSHGWTPASELTTTQRQMIDAAAGQPERQAVDHVVVVAEHPIRTAQSLPHQVGGQPYGPGGDQITSFDIGCEHSDFARHCRQAADDVGTGLLSHPLHLDVTDRDDPSAAAYVSRDHDGTTGYLNVVGA